MKEFTSQQVELAQKVTEWVKQSTQLKELKESEMRLRKEICAHMFGDRKGKFNVEELIGNFKLKASSNIDAKLDEDMLDAMYDDLNDQEKACIRYKPSLKAAEVKLLPEDSDIFTCITVKPAAPTLEIKAEIDLNESPIPG